MNAEEVPDIAAQTQAARDLFARWENGDATEQDLAGGPVSYTHLTLPTSDLV